MPYFYSRVGYNNAKRIKIHQDLTKLNERDFLIRNLYKDCY